MAEQEPDKDSKDFRKQYADLEEGEKSKLDFHNPSYVYHVMDEFTNSHAAIRNKVKSGELKCDRCCNPFPAPMQFFIKIDNATNEAICNRCALAAQGTSPEEIVQKKRAEVNGQQLLKQKQDEMEISKAQKIAQDIVDKLTPHCDKINIAGSIRRKKADVGDIEIVALPKTIETADGFFDVKSLRSPEFVKVASGLGKIDKGDLSEGRMVQIELEQGIMLDLFIPQKDDYYRQYAIRTGSAKFSGDVIASGWKKKGWCGTEDGMRLQSQCKEVAKNKWKCIVDEPTLPPVWSSEEEFFQWLNVKWVEPKQRG